MGQLTEKCMAQLQQGMISHQTLLIERAVQLLIYFFSKFEGEDIEASYKQQQQSQQSSSTTGFSVYSQPSLFTFYLHGENVKRELKLTSNVPFGVLRRRISAELKIPVSNLRLQCKFTQEFIERYRDSDVPHLQRHAFYLFLVQPDTQGGGEVGGVFHPKNSIY